MGASSSNPWPFEDDTGLPAWDERCLALLPPSVDRTQIEEDLRLTPTQRLEKLEALLEAAEQLRGGGHDVQVLDLAGLERCKRAAGRAKDLLDLELIAALKRAGR